MSRMLLSLVFALIFSSPLVADPRKWTSSDGKFTVDAEYVESAGGTVTLKKADETTIEVPLGKLSKADRDFVARASLDPSVKQFLIARDTLLPIEQKRIEERIQTLKADLIRGKRGQDTAAQYHKAAENLRRMLGKRLTQLKEDDVVPRISPKDWAVGQIGALDDDLQFTASAPQEEKYFSVVVVFKSQRYLGSWADYTLSRPDNFLLESPLLNPQLKPGEDCTALLKSHAYEVSSGTQGRIVLRPFDMLPVKRYFAAEAAKKK